MDFIKRFSMVKLGGVGNKKSLKTYLVYRQKGENFKNIMQFFILIAKCGPNTFDL